MASSELNVASVRAAPIKGVTTGGRVYRDTAIRGIIYVLMLERGRIDVLPRDCTSLLPGLKTIGAVVGAGNRPRVSEQGKADLLELCDQIEWLKSAVFHLVGAEREKS